MGTCAEICTTRAGTVRTGQAEQLKRARTQHVTGRRLDAAIWAAGQEVDDVFDNLQRSTPSWTRPMCHGGTRTSCAVHASHDEAAQACFATVTATLLSILCRTDAVKACVQTHLHILRKPGVELLVLH